MRVVDMRLVSQLFGMDSGYVLDFTNQTFSEFFRDELRINIDDPRYSVQGVSKAKRLRHLLGNSDPTTRIRVLTALWEYRQAYRRLSRIAEDVPDAEEQFYLLLERLGGKRPRPKHSPAGRLGPNEIDQDTCVVLKHRLLEVSALGPQARGYAYESFLKELFDANGLAPRASFRLIGEQIDGSFELAGETYLLEAKWQGLKTGAADLRSFNAKVEDKAAWARGLFVSESGFTDDGLAAFGRGKRVVCMDGLDLYDMLDRRLAFAEVMSQKVRRAAEDGTPFSRVRDLF